jgi:hypothetical protein
VYNQASGERFLTRQLSAGGYVIDHNFSTIRTAMSLQRRALLHRLSQITYAVDTRDVMLSPHKRPQDTRDDRSSANHYTHSSSALTRVSDRHTNFQAVLTSRFSAARSIIVSEKSLLSSASPYDCCFPHSAQFITHRQTFISLCWTLQLRKTR